MATKKITAKAVEPEVTKVEQAEVDVPEAEKAEPEVVADVAKPSEYTPYVPVELRTKLEGIAIKMLTKLEKYPGDFNEGQLKTVEAVLNIYSTIRY